MKYRPDENNDFCELPRTFLASLQLSGKPLASTLRIPPTSFTTKVTKKMIYEVLSQWNLVYTAPSTSEFEVHGNHAFK